MPKKLLIIAYFPAFLVPGFALSKFAGGGEANLQWALLLAAFGGLVMGGIHVWLIRPAAGFDLSTLPPLLLPQVFSMSLISHWLPQYLAMHALFLCCLLFGLGWLWWLFHHLMPGKAYAASTGIFFLTALFGLARVPWKYPYDFESYVINVFLFPLFLLGLYPTASALFNKAWAYKICLPVFLLFIFPAKALVKVLFDKPSPWGMVSPLLGILVLAGGYWLAVRTLDKNPY